MSLKIIELNDAALKVGDDSGIILQSPGFALAQDKSLLLGELAEQKARLHPTQSYNKYWHELSLDPLSHGNGIRHFADIAYAQLLHLAEQASVDDEVIFAVPGNFTRQQLAILLGLASQCPFKTVGVVDSALAAAIATGGNQHLVYAELQLHQVMLTRLETVGGHLAINSSVQIPGVGSQNVIDQMMQLATNAFIQQCRFNPQHNAESEQQLYNALPHWWRQPDATSGNLVLELRVGNTVHTAKLSRENLISSLGTHFQKINQQLGALVTDRDSRILLNAGLAALPGLQQLLGSERDTEIIDTSMISSSCLVHHDAIRSDANGIRRTTRLPLGKTVKPGTTMAASADHEAASEQPTHVLFNNKAIALDKVQIVNGLSLNGHTPAHVIQMSLPDLPVKLGQIRVTGNDYYLETGKLECLLNNLKVSGSQKLKLGDRIQFAPDGDALTLIRVG